MDSLFGISSKALELSEHRSVMLAGNIANASTPNYKAKDLDFRGILRNEYLNQTTGQNTSATDDVKNILYRVPMQKSLDGNTVDEEVERKNFLDNALHYQMNLTFIQNKAEQLLKAIKGE